MSDQHWLIVYPQEHDPPWEIVHPNCPIREHQHGYPVYDCGVGYEEENGDVAFSLQYSGTPMPVEPGRYPLVAWFEKIALPPHVGTYEYDGGLAIGMEGEQVYD